MTARPLPRPASTANAAGVTGLPVEVVRVAVGGSNLTDKHARAMAAIRSIERRAWNLALKPRRSGDARGQDAWVIERELMVLVLAVEAAYRGHDQ